MNAVVTPWQSSDLSAIKSKQRNAWASGDYAVVGTTLQIVGEELCEAIDLRSGSKVLDVAAGNGNATLAAARRYADVTSTDYVETLLQRGRTRAEADGLSVQFQVADAEDLPFDNDAFDVVVSTFGVMFTPNQAQAASELARVCRSGGIIAMANWTPESFIGQVFKTLGKHIAPAPGMQSPARWGQVGALERLFAERVSSIKTQQKAFVFRYHSTAHFLEVFRTFYGPMHKAYEALGEKSVELEADLTTLCNQFNEAGGDGFIISSDYLEVIITK